MGTGSREEVEAPVEYYYHVKLFTTLYHFLPSTIPNMDDYSYNLITQN